MRIDENIIRYLSIKTKEINKEPSILSKKSEENKQETKLVLENNSRDSNSKTFFRRKKT